ncbi:MAG: hypothetical protein JO303_01415 [Caulobacteraceae bacterium]|nr:hypothetical protein [Caulobacteraceae bacterium]
MNSSILFVTYAQVAVFNSNLQNPFNDWNDAQVNQGFSWREQSVSFRTLLNDVSTRVEVDMVEELTPLPNSIRVISVPFRCGEAGRVEVATITDTLPIDVPPGLYQLVFEAGVFDRSEPWCRFSLIANGDMSPAILRKDAELSPEYPLTMGAHAA